MKHRSSPYFISVTTLLGAIIILILSIQFCNGARTEAATLQQRLDTAQEENTLLLGRCANLEDQLAETIYIERRLAALEVELAALREALTLEPELLTPCGLTVQELESGLRSGLKPYAADFMQAEQETGANAVFLAAVAALESGWASSPVAKEKNNLYGWMGSDGYMEFGSAGECIAYVAGSLKELYLSPSGRHFSGYSVEAVNVRYNGNPEWEEAVRQIMSEIAARAT